MEVKIKEVINTVKKIYETINLKNGVELEKLTILTYDGDTLIDTNVNVSYINNKVTNGIILLFDKNVRELHRNYNIFQTNDDFVLCQVHKYMFNAPFDYILELGDAWEEKLELLIYKSYDHTLRTLDNIELPKRVYFDYLNGIKDGNFDLKPLLEHLKTLESIELLSDVKSVPYYNYDEDGCRKHIEFNVRPTDTEWAEILITKPNKSVYMSRDLNNQIATYYGMMDYLIGREDD